MKTVRILSLMLLGILAWSCSDDDSDPVVLEQPTFSITAPSDDSGLYIFENTTPNRDKFYNYWEFTVGGQKVADVDGPIEYQYDVDGLQIVTLTMVSPDNALQSSQTVIVTLPPPPD